MRIDLSIIKILIVSVGFVTFVEAWTMDMCQIMSEHCIGCKDIKDDIEDAADAIDEDYFKGLEDDVSKAYKKKILKPNLKVIDKIQEGITKNVAHIKAMEHQANIDTKELNFLLQKNKELFALPTGSK